MDTTSKDRCPDCDFYRCKNCPRKYCSDETKEDTKTENPKDKIGKTKPDISLVPPVAVIQEAVAMGLGAAKYGAYNWRDSPVRATVYVSAAMRHLYQWLDGEELDGESGVSHLAHVRACCGIVLDAKSIGCLIDDRPKSGAATMVLHTLTKEKT